MTDRDLAAYRAAYRAYLDAPDGRRKQAAGDRFDRLAERAWADLIRRIGPAQAHLVLAAAKRAESGRAA